ncbi:hypothetical protein [Sporosarcina koreensis]|uniref:hypothetical protein n=1 Tax=Sporosarcina koreensis TaxID=334735 RepID=UPI00128FADFD|nr:hypothetical protein [Sporosarcina koreensis]
MADLDARRLDLDARQLALDAERPALDARWLVLDAGQLALDARRHGLDVKRLALDAERPDLDAAPSSIITKRTVTESQLLTFWTVLVHFLFYYAHFLTNYFRNPVDEACAVVVIR